MKIKTIDASTKKPAKNLRIQLQVKGKDSGYLTLTSDMDGNIILDEKYKGQQIAVTATGGQPTWTAATDGATLTVSSATHAGKAGTTTKDATIDKNKASKETWK